MATKFLSWLSGGGGTDKVKLETMVRIKSIPRANTCTGTDFPVLVRVTAPQEFTQRPGVDLVAVLDTSPSMRSDNKLESMIEAALFVVDHLGSDDRLSIVTFHKSDHHPTELIAMSEENREAVRTMVGNLKANGGSDMGGALQKAATILSGRAPDESSSRIGRIMFLSDGADKVENLRPFSAEFPADTFGLGADHNPEVLRHIADKTSGVYSYVNENPEKMKQAFAQSIGGLTSVAAMGIEINLRTEEGVSISSIDSGSYPADINTGMIQVNDLCAGERKNFIVYLTVPQGKVKQLMTVGGSHKGSKQEAPRIQLGEIKAVVARPEGSTRSEEHVDPEVAAELARLELVKGVSAMAEEGRLDKKELQSLWAQIKGSEDGRAASKSAMSVLDEEMDRMQSESQPMAFMLSWLTSHLWQRATTMGSPSASSTFLTAAMTSLARKADNPEPQQPPKPVRKGNNNAEILWEKVIVGKKMLEKVISWARRKQNPYSRALSCVALLLLAAFLLRTYVITPGPDTDTDTEISPPPPVVIFPVVDVKNSSLMLLDHPGWPKMEEALEVTMRKEMTDAGITSLLRGASAEYLRTATNRYLYLAIVHATLLENRCKSEDVGTIFGLEQKIKSLEAEKETLRVTFEGLAAKCAAAGNDRDAEVLDKANERVAELKRQLQDKKAFADSLMLEVDNTNSHLKDCQEKIKQLDPVVSQMEGQ
uniref:Uncharacterized protein n=1 Tax=Avena sativa TaxID=4498 RepID=A0ACD5ZTB5_AVESA